MEVLKRDNFKKCKFDSSKILKAIKSASNTCDKKMTENDFNVSMDLILKEIESKNQEVITTSEIDTIVENVLMKINQDVARNYIECRCKREVGIISGLSITKKRFKKADGKENDRQNANVNALSFGGRKGESHSVEDKEDALNYYISQKFARLHRNNVLYIHDLSDYKYGDHNCLSVPLDDALTKSMKIKDSDIRKSGRISSASANSCVFLQVQSQEQFGGVSATHIDFTFAKYLRKSFYKSYEKYFERKYKKNFSEYISNKFGYETYIKSNGNIALKDISQISIDDKKVYSNKKFYKWALEDSIEESNQSIESLFHNLNTLLSRSGNQLPFSSINFGKDISHEGRIINKSIHKASMDGIGEYGRTSIFPCQIFQLDDKINAYKGTPNYDLFQDAIKSTANRLYPNYANADWSVQKEGLAKDRKIKREVISDLQMNDSDTFYRLYCFVKNNPDEAKKMNLAMVDEKLTVIDDVYPTEDFSTMGAVRGDETVSIKVNGEEFNNICIDKAIDIVDKNTKKNWINNETNKRAYTKHKDVENENCFIKSKNEWVSILKIEFNDIDSPLKLYEVIFNKNGVNQTLHITEDHPLHTNRGRIVACELKVGDKIYDSETYAEYEIISVKETDEKCKTYDFTTSNDMFDLSGIVSHNCRTNNGFDINFDKEYFRDLINVTLKNGKIPDNYLTSAMQRDGRGNIAPATLILPTIAMLSKKKAEKNGTDVVEEFMSMLEKHIGDCKDELIERFNFIASQSVESAPFMYTNNTMKGYIPEQGIISALKHGTLGIGQLGLAECLQILIGCDHSTDKGMELAIKIEQLFKKKADEYKEKYKLNFGVYYSPSENLCYTAYENFVAKYGLIENVTAYRDEKGNLVKRGYFTNSMHIPVWTKIDPYEKIDRESKLTGYSSAGCITYVELDENATHNLKAIEDIIIYAKKKDIPYFAINIPLDFCTKCGYRGVIKGNCCPNCGAKEYDEITDEHGNVIKRILTKIIERLRRVTGYLTGNFRVTFNDGKQREVEDRVKHSDYMSNNIWKRL